MTLQEARKVVRDCRETGSPVSIDVVMVLVTALDRQGVLLRQHALALEDISKELSGMSARRRMEVLALSQQHQEFLGHSAH